MSQSHLRYLAHMSHNLDSIEYAPVSDSQRAAALALLVSQEPATERAGRIATILTALRSGTVSADTLVGANRGERLIAVAWGQILPGRTALLWSPRLAANETDGVADRLQAYLDEQLRAAGMRMAQAVLSDMKQPDAKRLLRVGYEHAADLLYLICPLEQVDTSFAGLDVDFVPYANSERERLSALVERTYTNTLDVPALDGVRDMSDVLQGYEQTGEYSPDRWFFIQHAGEDVGCLLLNDHPMQQQWELVYLGIVPESRGNGWGEQATRFAQSLARGAGRERLILAVDAQNDPAVNAYTKAGFFELLRRSVFLKIFGT
ncbi:MAG: GNAT family N-acetyltransferase [Planctomycetaceae bacterium]|nr:GNAT family N-acetyltransferase [Planctomycetales bacterium]MCB9874066.1 GNAT family N-acetyltransferase [Planctomycetaceae bacterium]MCB9937680.1 GNAT family N-acetyltransferase [Planctomycetaceae bacterium]